MQYKDLAEHLKWLVPAEQVVQDQLDAYNRRDLEAWLATHAADAEQHMLHAGLLVIVGDWSERKMMT